MVEIVDGNAMAEEMQQELIAQFSGDKFSIALAILVVGRDPVTASFVTAKKKFAQKLGIVVSEIQVQEEVTTAELIALVTSLSVEADGVVVQLPLPTHVDTEEVLNAIPVGKDVDVLGNNAYAESLLSDALVVPPVAGAVLRILDTYNVEIPGAQVVVVGKGRLVGEPVGVLLQKRGAHVSYLDRGTSREDFVKELLEATIVVSGAGAPGLITEDLISEDVVLIDAGTSSVGRVTKGDIDFNCASKARLFAKTPGGVGPLTVAMLFKNLAVLTSR